MNNQQVREWYKKQVSEIPSMNEAWVKEGLSVEQRARKAWQIRHGARLEGRELMEDRSEVELLRNRDLKLYGNPDGPTFEYLVHEATKCGLKGDTIFEAIISGSYTTNAELDKRFQS